jgi:hypothetical protein
MSRLSRVPAELVAIAAAGMVAFLLPVVLDPPRVWPAAPMFPLAREAVEHLRAASFLGIAAIGFAAGLFGRTPWALAGLATMALFPACMFAELTRDNTSHNLFPLELVMYALCALPALGAAAVGRGLQRTVRREPRPA